MTKIEERIKYLKFIAVLPSDVRRKERKRLWQTDNREKVNASNRASHWKFKREVLLHYGGPVCLHCGETDLRKLQLDHTDNDGAEHRKALYGEEANDHNSGYLSAHFYRYLRSHGYPTSPRLQVLCIDYNEAKSLAVDRREIFKARYPIPPVLNGTADPLSSFSRELSPARVLSMRPGISIPKPAPALPATSCEG